MLEGYVRLEARELSFLKSLQDIFTQNLQHLLHTPFKTLNINIQLNPAISKSQGKWKKKLEIAGFRNNRESVK